jgi:aspartate 1-decarboxylase
MRRRMMKSKIHRATVSDANLHYVGSITLDTELMALADIREWEQVAVVDIDNGARFETYAINGAAARLVHPGDRIIVITYGDYEDAELEAYEPRIVHVDTANRPIDEQQARALAKPSTPGPIIYTEIQAQVDREMARLDEELGGL